MKRIITLSFLIAFLTGCAFKDYVRLDSPDIIVRERNVYSYEETAGEIKDRPMIIHYDLHMILEEPSLKHRGKFIHSKVFGISSTEAVLLCRVFIDKKGVPQNIQIVKKAGLGLEGQAMEKIKKMKFSPVYYRGFAEESIVNVRVFFPGREETP